MNRNNLLIEADELMEKMGSDNLRIFDASIVEDIYEMGHIPGSVYFDHTRFSDPNSPYEVTISPEALLAEQIGNAGISNDTEVVLYAPGMLPYAIRAWWVLWYAGHRNVRVLNGGLDAWKLAGGQIVTEKYSYAPATFKSNFTPSMFVTKEDVLDSLKDENSVVVNVMPPLSYEGKHITGSVCVSSMDLMIGMDALKPNDQLALQLQETAQKNRIITYCGGGIAATVNAAAHLITGHANVAVYDGSLYEWLAEGLPSEGTGKWEIWKQAA